MYEIGDDYGMCGRCGCSHTRIQKRKIEFKENGIHVSYFGICPDCGELLGTTQKYFFTGEWDYVSREECEKVLAEGG